MREVICLVAACSTALAAHVSAAEVMPDPTRPPAVIVGDAAVVPQRPVLQSIIITPHMRSAIIDDQRVELNGRFRDAVVAQITETEVVLRTPGGIETLRMYPGVEKAPKRGKP